MGLQYFDLEYQELPRRLKALIGGIGYFEGQRESSQRAIGQDLKKDKY